MVLQYLVFACFQGGKGPFLAVRFFFKNCPSVEFHCGGETAWLGVPYVALRGVRTVSYSPGLECILADFFLISNFYFLLEFSTNAYL